MRYNFDTLADEAPWPRREFRPVCVTPGDVASAIYAGYLEFLDHYFARERVVRRGLVMAAGGFRHAFRVLLPDDSDPIPTVQKAAWRCLNVVLTHRPSVSTLPQTGCTPARGFAFLDAELVALPATVLDAWGRWWPGRADPGIFAAVLALTDSRHAAAREVAADWVAGMLAREVKDWRLARRSILSR